MQMTTTPHGMTISCVVATPFGWGDDSMIHPSTECTDQAARNHIINNADIKAELEAYWQRCDEIWQALPVVIDGVTFTHWWQLNFEDSILLACRAKKPSPRFLEAYVYLALRRLFKGINRRDRASP